MARGLLGDFDPLAAGLLQASAGLLTPPALGGGMAAGLRGFARGAMEAQEMERLRKRDEIQSLLIKSQIGENDAQARYREAMLAKETEAQRQRAEMQGMLRSRLGSPVSGALAAGANAGSVGPTVDNAARLASGRGGFPFTMNDVLALKTAGGPDFLEALKYASTPEKMEGGAVYRDRMTGAERFIPRVGEGVALDPRTGGASGVPGYAQANANNKAWETGAVEAAKLPYFQQQEQTRAALDPFTFNDPQTGAPRVTSRLDAVGGRPGGMPGGMGGSRGPGAMPLGTPGFGLTGAGAPGGFLAGPSPSDAEQNKAIAKSWGEAYTGMQTAGMQAASQLNRLNRTMQLLERSGGGRFSPTLREAASMAATFGIKLDPKLGDKEAAESLAIEMANGFRKPGTGVMTDKDFDNFKRIVPDLAKTPQGRAQIFGTMRGFLERDRAEADMARKYRQRYGKVDEGFFSQLEAWRDRNPVFRLPEPERPGATGSW